MLELLDAYAEELNRARDASLRAAEMALARVPVSSAVRPERPRITITKTWRLMRPDAVRILVRTALENHPLLKEVTEKRQAAEEALAKEQRMRESLQVSAAARRERRRRAAAAPAVETPPTTPSASEPDHEG